MNTPWHSWGTVRYSHNIVRATDFFKDIFSCAPGTATLSPGTNVLWEFSNACGGKYQGVSR